jgi:hypothetical protein
MATILRKKAPFHCRAPKVLGQPALCLAVLTDADGDECPPCAAKLSAAKEKFWTAPVREERPSTEAILASIPNRVIWP